MKLFDAETDTEIIYSQVFPFLDVFLATNKAIQDESSYKAQKISNWIVKIKLRCFILSYWYLANL